MLRVKIKTKDSKDPRRHSILLQILSNNDIFITKLIPVNDGFVVITSTDEDQDKIFLIQIAKSLEEHKLYPQLPPELRAKRSIIIFNVDPYIYNNTEEEITEELKQQNPWISNINNVFKFPNSKTIKSTFDQAALALKASDQGLRLFHMSIPKHKIQQEKFYEIQTCFRCYVIEDHYTNKCPQNKHFKICSECAGTDHTWRECNSTMKKCIRCDGEHKTLSMKCPIRKAAIKEKREKEKDTTSYANAAKKHNNCPLKCHWATTNIRRQGHTL
ncbi:hypothetical protein E2C01_032346 [Portunus trituberculatus]|uniref:Nucleic-acid-binding protein from transposon X-element n=1 Tax=Portunus trituberculatus TaxID=210409 RepID=A0A5B7EV31_PORTR|nr:hypothetical protein [Portunus trituberculatus]